jgi:hypothetical protein
MERIMKEPTTAIEEDDAYFHYLEQAWEKFDKVPHRTGMGHGENDDLPYFARLKENVIAPLGFNTDLWL